MKREIKFRGRRTDNGEWVSGYLIEYNVIRAKGIAVGTVNMSCECEVRCNGYRVISETVGQFTGLPDKNGKEIYEGDIVRWDYCSNGEYWRLAVVEINPDIRFNCAPISKIGDIENSTTNIFHYGNFAYTDTENHLEIIGNVYNNPKFLTKSRTSSR